MTYAKLLGCIVFRIYNAIAPCTKFLHFLLPNIQTWHEVPHAITLSESLTAEILDTRILVSGAGNLNHR